MSAAPATLAEALAGLRSWRGELAQALADLRRWALVNGLCDEHTAARIAHLERRLQVERLTVAFVAEATRGKSELVNALFLAGCGGRLLPSAPGQRTLCATEIAHDASQPPAIRLLPMETRAGPRSLRELVQDESAWTAVALDPAQPESLAASFEALAQTREMGAAQARELGLPAPATGTVEVPRWRHALVNLPHPLFDLGLVVLDTPGREGLAAEPELTLHRLPEADAVVFVLSAEAPASEADVALWREHVAPIEGLAATRFVALNKADTLRDGTRSDKEILVETDRRAREAARALGVDRRDVFPLSARQGLAARIAGSDEALAASRLPALERALAAGLARSRRADHAAAARAEAKALLAEAHAVLSSRTAFVEERIAELDALHGKNAKLVESLGRKSADERARLEETRAALVGLRSVHHRHAQALAVQLDPAALRRAGEKARAAVASSPFSAGINEATDGFFREARERLARSAAILDEMHGVMNSVGRRFSSAGDSAQAEVAAFPTERFRVEIDRLEAHCRRDFRSASSLLTRGRQALGALFFDTVVQQAAHAFEIADRDARAWMGAFIRPLEAQLAAIHERAQSREAGMEKMRDADTGLTQRLEEMRRYFGQCEERDREWSRHRERLERLLAEPAAAAVSAR